jgi:hypothetical protein
MITLGTICEAIISAKLDARVWIDRGYLYIDSPSESKLIRLSLDRENR